MKSTRAVRNMWQILALLLVFLFSPQTVLAQRGFQPGAGETGGQIGNVNASDVATIKGFEAIFSNVITVALELSGIVLFVMFLIGGFKYLTAGGDPKAVEAAKGTLTHAIIGLVVLVLAYIILLIIKLLTGVDVTTFKVYKP